MAERGMAAGPINEFITAFGESGYARANRFRVSFQMPSGIGEAGYFTNTNSERGNIAATQNRLNGKGAVDIMCHTCTLPSREIQGIELKQYGPVHRMPVTGSYMPVSFAFYSGADLAVREYFETWQTAAINISSNTFNFYDEYTSDIKIQVLDVEDQVKYTVDIYEAWPSSVSQVDYSYSNNDTAQSFMVVMQYRYWQAGHDDTRVANNNARS